MALTKDSVPKSSDDLQVQCLSHCLSGKHVDVIVSGSIGAVEAVRFIRALRRLGAQITPWLTSGGAQFTTPMALSWAAAKSTVTAFSGEATHIATGDACVIAPASANFIAKMSHGIADDAASTLVQSYLGKKKPVLFVANMHDSLMSSPVVARNIATAASLATQLSARSEEGKQKFPPPEQLADEVAHHINRLYLPSRSPSSLNNTGRALLVMGPTRGYIDDVRYISNYSSGALGREVANELYRRGHDCHVVSGPAEFRPSHYYQLDSVLTNDEMAAAALKAISAGADRIIMMASVLDFIPSQKQSGKLSSHEQLDVAFLKTEKIISKLKSKSGIKIGFKLEADCTEKRAADIARDYMDRYDLSLFILNLLSDVSDKQHSALVFNNQNMAQPLVINGKRELAMQIVDHVTGMSPSGPHHTTPILP